MSETAVGLFRHSGAADAVVEALRNSGFPSEKIRVIAEPKAASVDSATSTPQTDFVAALTRDLRGMGASDSECQAYVSGLRNGNVLVFANASSKQEAGVASAIMNERDAVEVDELVGAIPALPGTSHGTEIGARDISSKEDRLRAKTDGARVFAW